MQLTKEQVKAIDNFIEEIGKMEQFKGVGRSNDLQKSEIHERAYHNLWRGGNGWGCIQQGGTGQMRMLVWYQNICKPNSKEWRPAIIIKAVLAHLGV